MTTVRFDRPGTDEYFQYYSTYVDKVPSGDLLSLLDAQVGQMEAALRPLSEDRGNYAYAPGKWTIKEVVGHLADAERVFAFRALTFARGDQGPLPSFDENAWIGPARFNDRTLASLVDELVSARRSTLTLLRGLPADSTTRTGVASGKSVSVRALAHILHGHVAHHLGVLADRYR